MFKTLIKNVCLKFGYHILRRFYYDFNADDSIKKIISYANINPKECIVFDVGANAGQSVNRFRNFLPEAKILSFEPYTPVFEILKEKEKKDKNLNCFNIGLGSKKRVFPFYRNPDSGSNSFYKINIYGDCFVLSNSTVAKKNHNKKTPKEVLEFNTKINVSVDTLDNICKKKSIKKIDILKIDTQGFEEEVLKGATNMLKNVFIIELEIIFSDIYKKSSKFGAIDSLLSYNGFNLWEISYIGKFATNKFSRINFIDVQYVNLNMLK